MISAADFEELFPDLFGPEAARDGKSDKPSPACLLRWEGEGGQIRQGPHPDDRSRTTAVPALV